MRKKNNSGFLCVLKMSNLWPVKEQSKPAGLIGLDGIWVLNQARLCFTFYPCVSCKKASWKIKHSHLCVFIIEGKCARISGLFSAVHFWHLLQLNKVWGLAPAEITRVTVCFLDNWPQTKYRVNFDTYFWFIFSCSCSHGSLGFAFFGSFFNRSES